MENVLLLDREREESLIQKVCLEVSSKVKFESIKDCAIFCVGPKYSSSLAMRVAHSLVASDKLIPNIISIDIPNESDSEEIKEKYLAMFTALVPMWKQNVARIVLVYAKDFNYAGDLVGELVTGGYTKNSLTVVKLVSASSEGIVGEVSDKSAKFWWQAD
jgi:hypothetical protein